MSFWYLENEDLLRHALMRSLESAKRSLWIATANVKQTMVQDPQGGRRYVPLIALLADLARRRAGPVEVRILHGGKPSGPFMRSLRDVWSLGGSAVAMRRCTRVHFKTIVVDGASAYVGSANLTGAGLGAKGEHRRNFEVGFWTDDGVVVRRLRGLFERIWDGAECGECFRPDDCSPPLAGPCPP